MPPSRRRIYDYPHFTFCLLWASARGRGGETAHAFPGCMLLYIHGNGHVQGREWGGFGINSVEFRGQRLISSALRREDDDGFLFLPTAVLAA